MPLYPQIATPLPVERRKKVATQNAPAYPKAPLRDANWQVVRDANGHVVMADGYTAWKQWIEWTSLVQKNAYLVYSRRFGPDLERATRSVNHSVVSAQLQRTIVRALKSDTRTKDIKNFSTTFVGDQVRIGFTAVPVVGPPALIALQFGA